MKIEYLDNLGFTEEKLDVNNLKISLGKVEFYESSDKDFGRYSKIIEPDLRYFWDGERFGLHVSDTLFSTDDWYNLLVSLKNNNLISKLEILYIGRTNISEFLTYGEKLTELKYLFLIENPNLKSIYLSRIVKLIEFHAYSNVELYEVREAKDKKKLKKIDTSHCKIEEFVYEDLSSLEFLKIDNNAIKNLKITNSPNLKYLFASNNNISKFQIDSTTSKLNLIDLSFNPDLTDLEIKDNLNELESVNLTNTNLSLGKLKFLKNYVNLKEVRLENTSVQQSYPEEVEQGWEFLKMLFEESQVPFYHQKVLLLGNPNIGKTNLLYWWQNKEHPKNEIDKESTHGVKYSVINDIIKTPDGQNINLHFWDFGGQDYFHATHQLFFSKGSINLLIWAKENLQRDGSVDNFYNIDYWLRCIQQLSQDPENAISTDTIIVQNKFDLLETNKPALINQIDIEKAPYALNLNLFFTNVLINPDGNGRLPPKYLNHLEEQISDIISSKNYNRPKSWVVKYDEIISYETPVIDLNNLKGDINENKSIAQYFHDRGLILYFETCCEDKIFTKPQVFLTFYILNYLIM